MARPKGVEPLTARFVAEYSIQLSYGRSFLCEQLMFKITLLTINFENKV